MKIIINPKFKLFRWGPIDLLPIYADYWYKGMPNFSKEYPPGWSAQLTYFEKEKGQVACQFEDLYGNGEKIFRKHILDDKRFRLNYKKWGNLLKRFNDFKKFSDIGELKKLTDKEIKNQYLGWNKFYGGNFWNIGSLPEVANWGGEQMLERELRNRIKDDKDFYYAFEKLAAPEDISFYQKEELDLLRIKFLKSKKQAEKKLISHQKKYYWLRNSYHHTKILNVRGFKKILDSYTLAEARQKIKEISIFKINIKRNKIKVINEFLLPKAVLKIGQRLSFCVWWQDLRKSYIWQANHIIDNFFKEISRRYKKDLGSLYYYKVNEVEDLVIKNRRVLGEEIKKRKNNLLLYWNGKNEFAIFCGRKAKTIFAPCLNKEIIKADVKHFKGIVVNQGRVVGRVIVIKGLKEMSKMKKGNVLVAPMTSPDYIIALRKAAAIVTDEGGMTCHAAIVSRELKIPGIVGTKIATKVLKDGDLVEVDAIKGIVKIL
jgi:phosphohistidine swiveling domain-containing protein